MIAMEVVLFGTVQVVGDNMDDATFQNWGRPVSCLSLLVFIRSRKQRSPLGENPRRWHFARAGGTAKDTK